MSTDGRTGRPASGGPFCRRCGTAMQAEARFCGACGQAVAAPSRPARGGYGQEPQRAREVLRRLLAGVSVFVACAAFFFQPRAILEVSVRDFAADYLKNGNPNEPISQFMDGRLEFNSAVEKDPAWAKLVAEVRREASASGASSVFYPEDHPLAAGHEGTVIVQDGARRHYLSVTSRSVRSSTWSQAGPRPAWRLTSPLALYGIPFLLLLPLPLFLLRWKPGPRDVRYKGWVMVPFDVLGLALVGVAGAAFGGIAAETILTACVAAGFIGLFAALLLGASVYYAALRASVLPDRIRVITLFQTFDLPFAGIELATIRKESQSIAIGLILIVLGLTNLVTAVVGLLLVFRKYDRLTLRRVDGKTFRIWLPTSLNVQEEIVPALYAANVRILGD